MKVVIAAALLAVLPALAKAQTPAGTFSTMGTIAAVSADTLTIRDEAGAEQTYTLADKLLVLRNRAISLQDIKPNDFVASAAMRAPDGKLHSTELRVFPDALRGLGEGQRPMNDARQQTMTNATVTGTAVMNGSNNLKVTFAGGQSELVLDPGVPVTRIEEAPRDALRSGAKVRVQGTGTMANRVTMQ